MADPANGAHQFQLIPVLRARVVGVAGRQTQVTGPENVRRLRQGLAREFTITYRDHLEPNERVIDGQFWRGPSPDAEVSIEKGVHERSLVDVGDTMTFDILGRVVTAKVTSVRAVEWRDSGKRIPDGG